MTLGASYATVSALAAGVDALFASGQVGHAHVLAGELFEVLEAASRDGDLRPCETSSVREEHPTNAVEHMEATTGVKRPAMSAAERQANRRARLKVAQCRASKQLGLVTPVTRRDAPSVTNVTAGVTRDVTPVSLSVSSSLSLGTPKSSGGGEKENSLRESVTSRHAVTSRFGELDAGLLAIFAHELAHRPGVALDAGEVWAKFSNHPRYVEAPFTSRRSLEAAWRFWAKNERPTKVEAETVVHRDLKPENVAEGPGPRDVPVDLEELSRRIAVEQRERVAREQAEYEKALPSLREATAGILDALERPQARRAS